MPVFQVRGITIGGFVIDRQLRAQNEKAAFRFVALTYGRLQNGTEIFKSSQIEDSTALPKPPGRLLKMKTQITTRELIRIAEAISNGTIDAFDYDRFRTFFRPLLRSVIRSYWHNDMIIETREEIEETLYYEIATKVLPKYDQQRGKITTYVRIAARGIIQDRWKRETHINAHSKKATPKIDILKDHTRAQQQIARRIEDDDVLLEKVIKTCYKLTSGKFRFTNNKGRREFYDWVIQLDMHKEFIRFPRQLQIIEEIYDNGLKETEAAAKLNIKQPTVNCEKNRAEKNIINGIMKKYFPNI